MKNREFEEFDKEFIQRKNDKIHLAYSCIAFEFWLILHFQRNAQPFFWVDKGKAERLDVFTYFKTICPDYEKGDLKEKCTAYTCLYPNWKQKHQTIQDEWDVLFRIITGYKHVKWLQNVMLPILNRQSGKWYEVNPYVLGMDNLIAELLNIKSSRQPIDYFGLTFEFDFDKKNSQLHLKISVNDGEVFEITDNQKGSFEIKNRGETSFLPIIEGSIEFPNQNQIINLQYDIPEEERAGLVLIVNDPRQRSKSSQLFVLLN